VEAPADGGTRVLVLANETVGAAELLDELHAIDGEGRARYLVCVPANPVDTGQAEHTGAVWVWEETVKAAQARLDGTLAILRERGLQADGELGDHRPMQALTDAVEQFKPDRIVISTHPEVHSAWLRQDVVERARAAYPSIPVRHIVAHVTTPAGG
jgi:GABA permease